MPNYLVKKIVNNHRGQRAKQSRHDAMRKTFSEIQAEDDCEDCCSCTITCTLFGRRSQPQQVQGVEFKALPPESQDKAKPNTRPNKN